MEYGHPGGILRRFLARKAASFWWQNAILQPAATKWEHDTGIVGWQDRMVILER